MIDLVTNPPHYNQGDIECIDAIRAALTPEEFQGYCKGNAMKYLWREKYKGGEIDIRKANWYLSASLKKPVAEPVEPSPLPPQVEARLQLADAQEAE